MLFLKSYQWKRNVIQKCVFNNNLFDWIWVHAIINLECVSVVYWRLGLQLDLIIPVQKVKITLINYLHIYQNVQISVTLCHLFKLQECFIALEICRVFNNNLFDWIWLHAIINLECVLHSLYFFWKRILWISTNIQKN